MTAQSSQIKAKMFEIWLMRKIMIKLICFVKLKQSRVASFSRLGTDRCFPTFTGEVRLKPCTILSTLHDFKMKKKHVVLLDSNWWLMTVVS